MRLLYKFILILLVAFLGPVAVLGVSAYVSMRRISAAAGEQALRTQIEAERGHLLDLTRMHALEIGEFLASYRCDVVDLKETFEENRAHPERFDFEQESADPYPGAERAGLPRYGYVHPQHGAYANFEHKGPGCPWLPRTGVARARVDADFRAEATRLLHEVMLLDPRLARVAEKHRATLDLVWIVTAAGVTNVHPPYDYPDLIAKDAGLPDVDESAEDYVRLAAPAANPDRRVLWLEPYLDRFKWVWMTSCVAPIYDGDRFLGSVGMDILLPVVIEKVLGLAHGQAGYGFLIAPSGKLIAIPEAGIRDLVWDEKHAQALRATFLPSDKRLWSEDLTDALSGTRLDGSPDPWVAGVVREMRAGGTGTREVTLSGTPKFVAFAPVPEAGWGLGMVLPVEEAVAAARSVQDTIEQGTRRTIAGYLTWALLLSAVSVFAAFLLQYLAIQPLVRLSRQVERLSWDHLEFPASGPLRRDEIGQLEGRFGEMVRLIRRARDEITARGQELERANEELRREIGERVHAEKALSQEKELLAVTLGSIGEGVLAADVDGNVVLANPAAQELTGWSPAEAAGRPLSSVLRLSDARTGAPLECPPAEVFAGTEAGGRERSAVLVRKDGSRREVACSEAPIRDHERGIIGVVVVFRDVTERRRLDSEMSRIAKLESLRVLAAGIAHDFNNFLTPIVANLSMADAASGANDTLRPLLTEARSAASRAAALTSQLRAFTRSGAPVRKAIRIGTVMREAATLMVRGSQARCEFGFAEDLHPVLADEGQIGQLVGNLVLNASQAMPAGGVVRVRAGNVEVGSGTSLPLAPGAYVTVEVADEGVGIPPENLPRVFDPFFSTKPGGTGLGLAVCFSIVRNHWGHIEAESQVGRGTVFRFYLPACTEEPAEASAPSAQLPVGSGRVLMMDDEELIRFAAQRMLARLGYRAELARDGTEVLEKYRQAQSGEPFVAVILDLSIPGGMGGVPTLAALRAIDPDVKVIVASGHSDEAGPETFEKLGFSAVLPKPYELRQLAETLSRVVNSR